MAQHVSPVIPPSTTSSEERWAAWTAKGAARDRLLRRKMLIAAPILAFVAALGIIYAFAGARL
jgi:hypothetical protein